jgi:hypothetical protein
MLDTIDYYPPGTDRPTSGTDVGVRLSHLKRSRLTAPAFLNALINIQKYYEQESEQSTERATVEVRCCCCCACCLYDCFVLFCRLKVACFYRRGWDIVRRNMNYWCRIRKLGKIWKRNCEFIDDVFVEIVLLIVQELRWLWWWAYARADIWVILFSN